MPDGGQHAGVCPCEKGPSARCRDWTQVTTGVFPVHGGVPGGLHARAKTRTGGTHMKCIELLCGGRWPRTGVYFSSISDISLDVSCVIFTENGGFVLMCELKDLAGQVRVQGSREFKGIFKEKLTKTKEETTNLEVWVEKWSYKKGYGCS